MELINNNSILYLLFLVLTFVLCFNKNKKANFIIIYFVFIVFFVCSKIGSDYYSYKYIYESSLNNKNTEILYHFINKIFLIIGIKYEVFRIIYLSFFIYLFMFATYKMSPNFSLSILLTYLLYLLYFISAYRQFATISIFIFTIWLFYYKNNKILAIILNFVAIFLHVVAIIQFFIILILYYLDNNKIKFEYKLKIKTIIIIIIFLLILRCILCIVLKLNFIVGIISKFMPLEYLENVQFINFGLASRLVFLLAMTLMIDGCELTKVEKSIIAVYLLFICLYIAIPYELIMGRLVNNFKILEIIIFPLLIYKKRNSINYFEKENQRKKQLVLFTICIITSLLIYYNQLTKQDGYFPFIHYFLGEI